ncbi:Ephrin-B2a [Homalodisca vitripennis]|nr:Ephrin-B2a [Homalodisca vitripennis]
MIRISRFLASLECTLKNNIFSHSSSDLPTSRLLPDGLQFRIDNTDHIIDVNKGNYPFEYDQVNIICPVYTPGTHEEDAEKYIIYNILTMLTLVRWTSQTPTTCKILRLTFYLVFGESYVSELNIPDNALSSEKLSHFDDLDALLTAGRSAPESTIGEPSNQPRSVTPTLIEQTCFIDWLFLYLAISAVEHSTHILNVGAKLVSSHKDYFRACALLHSRTIPVSCTATIETALNDFLCSRTRPDGAAAFRTDGQRRH